MAEIVKSLTDAQEKGFLQQTKSTQSDTGKIISDIRDIVKGIQELRGVQVNNELEQTKRQAGIEPKPETQNKPDNKTPVAVLNINEKEIDNFLNQDLQKLIDNPHVNQNMTLKELIDNWRELKGLLKPEIKKVVGKIASANLEFK